jgi:T4 RnlA family RNA ligase
MINKHPEKDLYLVKYTHLGIDWSIEGALDARGLILDSSGNIIARPYKKFFNYKELEGRDDLPEHIRQLSEWEDGPYKVSEKIDGSLIIMFEYENELIFASSGSFTGEHAIKARELFDEMNILEKEFIRSQTTNYSNEINYGRTILFELVSPDLQIVIPYEKEELILHGIIDNYSGDFDEIGFNILKGIGIPTVEYYEYNQSDLLKIQKDAVDIEGFVVRFEKGKMLKIKTEDYFVKSKDNSLFFGKFFTYKKIDAVIDAIFDDTYDDLVASAVSHPKVKENIEVLFSYYKEFEKEMLQYQSKWKTGEFSDRKAIATNPETKPKMHMIFLAEKPRNVWKEFFKKLAYQKFIKDKEE